MISSQARIWYMALIIAAYISQKHRQPTTQKRKKGEEIQLSAACIGHLTCAKQFFQSQSECRSSWFSLAEPAVAVVGPFLIPLQMAKLVSKTTTWTPGPRRRVSLYAKSTFPPTVRPARRSARRCVGVSDTSLVSSSSSLFPASAVLLKCLENQSLFIRQG